MSSSTGWIAIMRLGGSEGSGWKYSSCALKQTAIMSGPSSISLIFSSMRAGDAELHDRVDPVHDGVLQALPVVVMDARHLAAVGLDGLLERSAAVDVGDRGAGIDSVDVLLRHTRHVLLRRAERIVRIGRARIAGDGDDQLLHGRS